MAHANGRLPASALGPIPGPNAGLRKDAATFYRGLHAETMRRWKISMALSDGSVGRTYRSYPRQVLAKKQYGSNAAQPGDSNHGLGLAVDLQTRQQRWAIDQIGRKYGFAKACSDASWEWWHVKFNPGCTGASYKPGAAGGFTTVRYGSKGPEVKRLQKALGYLGYLAPGNATGFFGDKTRSAVRRFQARWRLKQDGVAGPATWRKLRERNIVKRKGK